MRRLRARRGVVPDGRVGAVTAADELLELARVRAELRGLVSALAVSLPTVDPCSSTPEDLASARAVRWLLEEAVRVASADRDS